MISWGHAWWAPAAYINIREEQELRQLLVTWITITGKCLLAKEMNFNIYHGVWYFLAYASNKNVAVFLKDRQEE